MWTDSGTIGPLCWLGRTGVSHILAKVYILSAREQTWRTSHLGFEKGLRTSLDKWEETLGENLSPLLGFLH